MGKLKQALFEEALYQKRHYQRCKKELGEFDFLTLTHEGKYQILIGIIAEGECEDEFFAWEKTRQQKESA